MRTACCTGRVFDMLAKSWRCAARRQRPHLLPRRLRHSDYLKQRPSNLLRPAIFTGAVFSASFSLAAVANEEHRLWRQRHRWYREEGVVADLYRALISYPKECCVGLLVGLNGIVFMGWQSFPDSSLLNRLFLHYPGSRAVLPMLLSTFSHQTLPHFAMNMFALWSFGGLVLGQIGMESFFAAYVSAGTAASFASAAFTTIARRTAVPSLGASGAILGLASFTAFSFPDLRFSIMLLPFTAMPALYMIGGISALDFAGLALGWRIFDHAAHLGGTAAGAWLVLGGGDECAAAVQRASVALWRRAKREITEARRSA